MNDTILIQSNYEEKFELSKVVNLPSVELQMINSKLFQTLLADKSNLALYIDSVERISKFFGEYTASKNESEVKSEEKNLDKNMWLRRSVTERDKSIDNRENDSIYMKKIISHSIDDSFVLDKTDKKIIDDVIIFGGLISIGDDIIHNNEDEYIVRSEDVSRIKGGICSGNGALDSIIFYNE